MNNKEIEKCSGKDKRIVFIDSGISSNAHCVDIDGNDIFVNCNEASCNTHADICIQAALLAAPDSKITLINCGEKNSGILTEASFQAALKLCKDLSPDIIAMCFSLSTLSEETQNIISSLVNSGILCCASVDPILFNSYPQSLSEVYSVDTLRQPLNTEVNIILINNVFYIRKKLYSSIVDNDSSSFATGYFAGFLAKIIEFNPLATQTSIMTYYKYQSIPVELIDHTKKPTSYFLVAGQHDIDAYYDMIPDNYLYYYDDENKCFKDRRKHTQVDISLINEVDVICGDDFLDKLPTVENLPDTVHFNYYDNLNHKEQKQIEPKPFSIKPISIPSICIGSYGMNMEKLSIQLYLNRQLKSQNLKVGNISFNPIAHLFGYRYIPFPARSISYPQYIYDLSHYLYQESKDKDILVTSMAGSFDRFVDFSHRLGETSHLLMNVHNPDIVILCMSDFVELSEVIKAVSYITSCIGAKAVIYISDRSRDDIMYTSSNYNIRLTKMNVSAYSKEVKLLTKTATFTEMDLENDNLAKYILKMLT